MTPLLFRFVVQDDGCRLDRLVADATGCGRRQAKRWLRSGQVVVNGRVAGAAVAPCAGSEVLVVSNDPDHGEASLPDLAVVFADSRIVAIAKPAGIPCERGQSSPCVADLLEATYGDLSGIGARPGEAGLAHRLDRDTSGVLLAARSADEYRRLRADFARGGAIKDYLALVSGRLGAAVDVDAALARRHGRMDVAGRHDDAFPATTRLDPLEQGDGWTLVLATMRTGITHQVRVHAAATGHPLIGDALYGGPDLAGCLRRGQLLHALRVRVGGFDAAAGPPNDFLNAYARLRRTGIGNTRVRVVTSS